ncbi:enoyl-CoA hydratase/isomerase family protein [Brevundimonas variabilis]|uniref:Enoyl-CoA hydratase/carnithine racemase n=1 Tax=Brevundimonas variabilis TaxID=74312 RepID=A0A7W9CJJ4_9CAUL|nr:enoyl-CoA hydratase/isomerase family protein [Brevundimonas variabilis]MBB5746598.1 enoyl-CoA hydratase/carnithine racemase [Brevundimonas variabilis]
MTDAPVLSIEEADGVVVVRLNRPEARNTLNPPLIEALTRTAQDLRRRADVRAVVLTGTDTFFSAGIDLKGEPDGGTLSERRVRALVGPDLCRAWEEIEAVTIVAIEGYCVGGACALALACDFRVMGSGAMMRLPEVALGMNMSWGAVPRVTALIGPARAKRFIIEGAPTTAETCLAWGLADEVVDDGQAPDAARAWASRIAALPPLPVRMTKQAVNACATALHSATAFMDRDQFLLTLTTDDLREGVEAFTQKRPPAFHGD